MRTLQADYQDQGFTVLAFPCNQFGAQEPGSNEQILAFAQEKYDVNFPMFEKIDVNGARTCDLFKALKSGSPGDDGNEAIGWNFTKFLVGRDGNVIQRFGPQTTPEEVGKTLAALLAAQ